MIRYRRVLVVASAARLRGMARERDGRIERERRKRVVGFMIAGYDRWYCVWEVSRMSVGNEG